jgi:hypothetical protein
MSASADVAFTVGLDNQSGLTYTDYPVVYQLDADWNVKSALVTCDGKEIACQLDDLDQDGCFDELCFLADLPAKGSRKFVVTLTDKGEPRPYPSRVYAEMVMRNDKVKEKNKQNNYVESLTVRGDCANSYNLLHHHGVCFESELNGIRIYMDQRQTLDLYGKFQKRLELQQTQFYTSDEQKQQGYGDDVLWVGNTYGLGAFRGWDGRQPTMVAPVKSRTQRVVSYGPLRTIIEIADKGWMADSTKAPVDMTLRYTQYAGHRDTDIDVIFNRDVRDYTFSTGIINVKESTEFSNHRGLRACWGTDYPAADHTKWKPETVGLAIWIPYFNVDKEQPANSDNYAFTVSLQKSMKYRVAYCSANESFGFHSSQEWFDWVKKWNEQMEGMSSVVMSRGEIRRK